ncbi:MFS transporter [Rathayibacter sp. VKM Ac-2927]|uniref:MFS transporter n=1 Tax=Rathayibacter sp. VKM Ac-2927 TaxID=2929478 RepID=UPI001FB50F8F|nr:MFS transporter [Rathayibacter sp. VKM Ac-2927]MCJ1687165.1 MFS transporter [Rathayibacter sp. VKM Ac-2927]
MSHPAQISLAPRRRWATFGVLAATAALTILDVSKVGVALPAIQESTGGSGSTIQIMLVGYTIAYAAFLLPAGRIGDVLPRSAVFLVGGLAFVGASVVCALAPDISWLVAGRIAQGAGAGILMPQVLGLIQRLFPAEERTRPLATLAAILSATSLFGPVLAGVVMQLVGTAESWRALFWINVVVGAVVLPLAVILVRDPGGERRSGFDGVGVALLVPAVVLTIAPLSAVSADSPLSLWTVGFVAIGVGLATLFVLHIRRRAASGRQALVDPRLFRSAHLAPGVVVSGLLHAAGTAGTLIITIGLQQLAGLTPLETALWMLPAALAALAGSWIAARLPFDAGYRAIVRGAGLGSLGLTLVAIAFGLAPTAALPLAVCAVLMVNTFGAAVAAPANQARVLIDVPDYRSSVAGSMIQFAQRVGSAIGMAIALMLYYGLGDTETPAGRPTLGATLAVLVTGAFLLAAALIARADRPRLSRTPGSTAPHPAMPVGAAVDPPEDAPRPALPSPSPSRR